VFTKACQVVPEIASRIFEVLRSRLVYIFDGIAMHLHHVKERLFVFTVAFKSANRVGQFGTGQVRGTVKDRRQRSAKTACGIRIVSYTTCHCQTAQVGITQSKWTELVAVGCDQRSRITGMINEDFLSHEE